MSHAPPPIVVETQPNSFLFSDLGGSAPTGGVHRPWDGSRIVFFEFIVNSRH